MSHKDKPGNEPVRGETDDLEHTGETELPLSQPASRELSSSATLRKDPEKAGPKATPWASQSTGSPEQAQARRLQRKRSEKRKKSCCYSVRFTPERHALVLEKARVQGSTGPSEYLRTVALGPTEALRRDLTILIGELGRSGSSLNEMARQLKGEAKISLDLHDQLRTTLRTHQCTLDDALIILRALP